ncbi:hypothetical protein NVP1210O_56 [Vibrio phage 1.210.O._10N.222.52.C2]|nr:hypothetical protein NVP1210O_56 [Vibrio phage 1.210.O._10N.222.52.C2]
MVNTQLGMSLCKELYSELQGRGFFPALTGGLLYKDGLRKDIDIVIFRHRQNINHFEIEDIQFALESAGMSEFSHYGFVTKCKWRGFEVDLFNPETKIEFEDGDYGEGE